MARTNSGEQMGLDLGDAALNDFIAEGMTRVESTLQDSLSTGESFLTDKVQHLALAGGKRFRPMFALLASRYGSTPETASQTVVNAAVVVELTHLATLYHDDVMDEADRRRGSESANARWDNSVAILAGDFIFAVASSIMADLGPETVRHFAETFGELVTGQMRETVGCPEGEDPVDHYMTVIQEKTGVLIASAGFLGSMHGGAPVEQRDALFRFGRHLGQVFQIVDDIIDIASDSAQSGKNPGTDLREGVFTLPVLYALREEGPVGDRLREILVGPVTDEALLQEALELLERSTGPARALAFVRELVAEADGVIADLPEIPAKAALRHVAEYTVERVG